MKKINFINNLLKSSDLTTKITIYFSSKSAGDDYDPYEANLVDTNLNPKTIKGYVREISAESLVWRPYGLKEFGAKELICEAKYENWFKIANKIEIDEEEYEVFKEGVGGRAIIQKRPFSLIKITLQKKT